MSAPAWVNFTNLPLSCSTSQLFSIARSRPTSAGVPLSSYRNGPVDLLDQDAVVEVRLDRIGELDDLAGGDFGKAASGSAVGK